MRLFIAIPLSQQVRDALDALMARLLAMGVVGSFTRRENLHLTLAFLGETHRTECLMELLARLKIPSFELTVQGVGRFSDTWWAGIAPSPQLEELVHQLRRELAAAGFLVDIRGFSPHITLARRVQAPDGVFPAFARVPLRVDRIALMHSHRVNGLLTYTPVFERPLITVQADSSGMGFDKTGDSFTK